MHESCHYDQSIWEIRVNTADPSSTQGDSLVRRVLSQRLVDMTSTCPWAAGGVTLVMARWRNLRANG